MSNEIQVLENPVTPEHVTIQDRLMRQIVEMLQGNPVLTGYKLEAGSKYTPGMEVLDLQVSEQVRLSIYVHRRTP